MDIIYLLNSEFVKANTTLDNNVTDKILLYSMNQAQDLDLQRILGYTLMKKMKTGPSNEPYITLMMEFITPFLLVAIEKRCLYNLYLRKSAQGLIKNINDDTENGDKTDYQGAYNILDQAMNTYANDMNRYLESNRIDFPEYDFPSFDRPIADHNDSGPVYIDPEIQENDRVTGFSGYPIKVS
jgi:hypothetical protein